MARDHAATAFITGADSCVGRALVDVLVARGRHVLGLAHWQDEAAADWVFHLAPQTPCTLRIAPKRAAALANARALMDAHLLDAVAAGTTRRIVFVADTSCYGATGARAITEDEPPKPSLWGSCFTPAFDRLDGYVVAGRRFLRRCLGGCTATARGFANA
jgi:nucleoside-diphosphate-sugar epimerase